MAGKLAQDARTARGSLGLVAVKDGQQRLPHLARFLAGVDGLPDARLLVVAHNGGGLLVVGRQALLQGLLIIVGPLDQGLAGLVVGHGLLWRVENCVVAAARGGVDQAASDTRDQERIVDLQLDGVLQGLVTLTQHCVEAFGLRNGTGESIEDESDNGKVSRQFEHLWRQ